MKKVLIIGGGISGMCSAYFLKKLGNTSVTLVERQGQFGGKISTATLQIPGNKFRFEKGPRSLITRNGTRTLELIEDIGIADQAIVANKAARTRFIYQHGKMTEVTVKNLVRSNCGLLFHGLRELIFGTKSVSDETIYEFISRRFGLQAAKLIEPAVLGVFAGDYNKLSMKSCIPPLWNLSLDGESVLQNAFRKKCRSENIYKAESEFVKKFRKSGLYSFTNGMETLIDALELNLKSKNVNLLRNSKVQSLDLRDRSKIIVTFDDNKVQSFDHVISTISSNDFANILLKSTIPTPTYDETTKNDLISDLRSIKEAPITVVSLGYLENVIPNKFQGFGFLIPSSEKEDILGVTFDSCSFPEHNLNSIESRLTVMIGGDIRPGLCQLSKEKLRQIAQNSVSKILQIRSTPVCSDVFTTSIPQYYVGHAERISRIQNLSSKLAPNLTISGSSLFGTSVNSCIESSFNMCVEIDSLKLN